MSKSFDPDFLHYLRQYQRAVNAQAEYRRQLKKEPPPHKPIFGKQKRKHVIDRIVDELRDWRVTVFEKEGPLVAGIRSSLCLQGHGWTSAHREAVSLVSEALNIVGAERPTWVQGQREYTERDGHCYHCGGELPEDADEGRRKTFFCSAECAKGAMIRWGGRDWSRYCEIYAGAHRVINRSKTTVRTCEECSRSFSPEREAYEQRYCSISCYHKGMLKLPAVIRKVCVVCSAEILAKTSKAKYCSKRCESKQSRINYLARQKAKSTIYLTPELFDRLFAF